MEQKNNIVYGVAYGKLYLSGEYAILENNSVAILTTVNKKITASVTANNKTTIYDNINNKTVSLEETDKNFSYLQNFINFINNTFNIKKNFSLTIDNELHNENKKYGLGSSGAVLVAIAKAVLKYYNIDFNNTLIFKLVVLYNIENNFSGSMGDIAACCNEGLTYYRKCDFDKIKLLRKNNSTLDVLNSKWHGLEIKSISTKINIDMIAKWTATIIDTKEHIKLWNKNKNSKKEEYKKFLLKSNLLVDKLKESLETNSSDLFLKTINELRKNLLFLESISNIPMETPFMKKFISTYPAGKQSGSGSGDIVLGFKKNNSNFNIILDLEKTIE